MSGNWLLRTGIVVLLGLAAATPARAAMPDSELTKLEEPDDTFTSPDGIVLDGVSLTGECSTTWPVFTSMRVSA